MTLHEFIRQQWGVDKWGCNNGAPAGTGFLIRSGRSAHGDYREEMLFVGDLCPSGNTVGCGCCSGDIDGDVVAWCAPRTQKEWTEVSTTGAGDAAGREG